MPESDKTRVLLVDDNEDLRFTLRLVLEHGGFEVSAAANVNEALKLIGEHTFEVLVSDLHMPGAGDGLTVVSAMRHANPKAITLILSAHPEMKAATAAILAQTDDVLVKPGTGNLVALIREKIKMGRGPVRVVTSISEILEDEAQKTIADWLERVDADPLAVSVKLDDRKRSAHLPQLLRDLVLRLKSPLALGSRALTSAAAVEHGGVRREQGYTAAMMVEESRMLQVSIFQTLQNNLHRVNFSLLLEGVMTIADEVDSQLAQAMTGYITKSNADVKPTPA